MNAPFAILNSSFGTPRSIRHSKFVIRSSPNLALRGIEADFGPEHADTFRRDLHPDLRADYVLANPPFNDSDWFRQDDDVRWQFGIPPKGNANFAWVQHSIHHLAPHGMAGFVLANGSMSSNQSGDGLALGRFQELIVNNARRCGEFCCEKSKLMHC